MQYKAIVVGGPLDGILLTHTDTIYQFDVLPPEAGPPYYGEPADPGLVKSESGSYYYTSSVYHHGDQTRTIAFWVLREATILDAFDAIMERYQQKKQGNTLLRRACWLVFRLVKQGRPEHPDFAEFRAIMDEANQLDPEIMKGI